MALSDYLNDSASLLNDYNMAFTSKRQLTRWVNTVRSNLAKRTGCIERLITGQSAWGASAQPNVAIANAMQPNALPGPTPAGTLYGAATNSMTTIPNVERYPFKGFFNPFLVQQYAGVKEVIDCEFLSVNWGGASRPTLDWMSWPDFQAYCRAYAVLNSSYPSVWAVFNPGTDGEVFMFPTPTTYGEIEAQVACLPKPLYTDDDFDAIPEGAREAIKFGVAELAFMGSGRYSQAGVMQGKMLEALGIAVVAVDRGKTSSMYGS